MPQESAADPYLDPLWGILTNHVHARTQIELDTAENDLFGARAAQLLDTLMVGGFDLDHLRAIHRHLFQDIYPFAGQLRTVDMTKSGDPHNPFFPAALLRDGAANVFAALHEDNLLRGLDRRRFVSRLAHHLDAINHLHPFREGNGRAQRIFVSHLAGLAGYKLDWHQVTKEQNDTASREGEPGLRALLERITQPAPDPRSAISAAVRGPRAHHQK